MPKLSELIFGKKGKFKKVDTLTPDQQELMSLITEGLTSGEGPFGEMFGSFDQKKFQEGVANPAMKMFQEKILPQIQEKFIAGNQVLGSGMRRGQLDAATDMQDRLAQLMYQAQQGQTANRASGLQTALGTKGFESVYKPPVEGALQGLLSGLGKGIGQTAGAAIAG